MRPDGYVRVVDLLNHPTMRSTDLTMLEKIVKEDPKQRFNLYRDLATSAWWICANQGHTIPDIELDMRRMDRDAVLPLAIHGTTEQAWKQIAREGLSRMGRHHIHLAQGLADDGVISGMRRSSRILIYVDVEKAMNEDIPFYESRNGVILTPGDQSGFLSPRFFKKVEKVTETTTGVAGWKTKAIPFNHPYLAERSCNEDGGSDQAAR